MMRATAFPSDRRSGRTPHGRGRVTLDDTQGHVGVNGCDPLSLGMFTNGLHYDSGEHHLLTVVWAVRLTFLSAPILAEASLAKHVPRKVRGSKHGKHVPRKSAEWPAARRKGPRKLEERPIKFKGTLSWSGPNGILEA